MMDKVQKPNSNECYTPSLEPFRMYNISCNCAESYSIGNARSAMLCGLDNHIASIFLVEELANQERSHLLGHFLV
jgi:hypothetical protein